MVFTGTGRVTLLICLIYMASVTQAAYWWEPMFGEGFDTPIMPDGTVHFHLDQPSLHFQPREGTGRSGVSYGVVGLPASRYILNVFSAVTKPPELERVHSVFMDELERRGVRAPVMSSWAARSKVYEVFMATWIEAVLKVKARSDSNLLYLRAQYSALHHSEVALEVPKWELTVDMDKKVHAHMNKDTISGGSVKYNQVSVRPRNLVWEGDGTGHTLVFIDRGDFPVVVRECQFPDVLQECREVGTARLRPYRPYEGRGDDLECGMNVIGDYTASSVWDYWTPTVGPPRKEEPWRYRDPSCGMETQCGFTSTDGRCAQLTCLIASPRRQVAAFCVLNALYEYADDFALRWACGRYIDDDEGLVYKDSVKLTKARKHDADDNNNDDDNDHYDLRIFQALVLIGCAALIICMVAVGAGAGWLSKKWKELQPPRPSGMTAAASVSAPQATSRSDTTAPLLDTTPRETLWNGADGCEDGVRYQPPLISVCVEVGSDDDGSAEEVDIEVKIVPVTGGEW